MRLSILFLLLAFDIALAAKGKSKGHSNGQPPCTSQSPNHNAGCVNGQCITGQGQPYCDCDAGWGGATCALAKDCKTILATDASATSGVYTIKLAGSSIEFDVYCDMDIDGGGWTVFQKRFDGSENFCRLWTDYATGFGNMASGEFWLGNEYLHLMTAAGSQALKVELECGGTTEYADYSSFSVTDAADEYRLSVSGYSSGSVPDDGLIDHDGWQFSTKDNDNDDFSHLNCAADYAMGGWWYKRCYRSNLNGVYGVSTDDGLKWFVWKSASMTATRMMIRP